MNQQLPCSISPKIYGRVNACGNAGMIGNQQSCQFLHAKIFFLLLTLSMHAVSRSVHDKTHPALSSFGPYIKIPYS